MFYVYVLKSEKDRKLYIGYTSNLKKRLDEHYVGMNVSTKFRLPIKIVYYEAYCNKSDAMKREKKLKQFKNTYTELKKRIENSINDT